LGRSLARERRRKTMETNKKTKADNNYSRRRTTNTDCRNKLARAQTPLV
jgi:hypothetical protein